MLPDFIAQHEHTGMVEKLFGFHGPAHRVGGWLTDTDFHSLGLVTTVCLAVWTYSKMVHTSPRLLASYVKRRESCSSNGM